MLGDNPLSSPTIADMLKSVDPSQLATELYDDPMATMVINGEENELNQLERDSAIWLKLKKIMGEKLDNLRQENDKSLNLVDTAQLRGKILLCKEFLAIGEDRSLEYEVGGPGEDTGY